MKKLKIVLIPLILVAILQFIIPNSSAFEMIKTEKNIGDTIEYSQAYQEYLKLSEEEKSKINVIPRKYDIPFKTLYEDASPMSFCKTIVETGDATASTYRLDTDITIPLKNQYSYGDCWIFSTLTALETNLALRGTIYDFSEMHVDYSVLDLIFQDTDRPLHTGGNFYLALQYFMGQKGPVLEADVPYKTNGNYTAAEIAAWDELTPILEVTQVKNFPTIDKKTNTYTTTQLEAFRSSVKQHIVSNGSIYAAIYSDDIVSNGNGKSVLYTPKTTTELPDHAISIIGWDDDFAIENFPEGSRPANSGAYIAQNSWGNWGAEGNGIFYISYDDVYVEQEMSGIVATSDTTTYSTIIIEDVNLYSKLKTELKDIGVDYNDNDKTFKIKDLAENEIYYMDLEGSNIEKMDGLEGFTGLIYLFIDNNKLKEIEGIKEFEKIYAFLATENSISDISPIYRTTLGQVCFKNQNLKETNLLTVNNAELPIIFNQAISFDKNTAITAKIYYNCPDTNSLSETYATATVTLDSTTGKRSVALDRTITETNTEGLRAIEVTISDTGFFDGTKYTAYYSTESTAVKGDANGDGLLKSYDAYMILQLALSGVAPTTEQINRLDMDNNNKINSFDAYLVLRASVGL